ncbi:MAG: hypothetical protein Q8P48_02515 [Deltaproteobacteria bacterium]|nr:hypothetical protein [Deltaproteobacteria bacterium]
MAITLTARYLAELSKGVNTPNVIIELALDGGVKRLGYHGRSAVITRFLADGSYASGGSVFAAGNDDLADFGVRSVIRSVSSLQNKIDTRRGFSTRGELKVVITGRDNFKALVRDEYLKNRRVTRRDGFMAPGFTFMDYAPTFTGIITDWSRKGDELTLTIADDLKEASVKVPEENSAKTQYIDYRNTHPADIMTDILLNRLGVDPAFVDTEKFAAERDMWLAGWRFNRVLTKPSEANEYLNELQIETNSFIVHDGEKISYKVFAPPLPGVSTGEWTGREILKDSFSQKSGYKDGFYNRVVVYYDYDESGNDKEENFESAFIAVDAASQDPSEWDEASTRVIKSKWIRSHTFTQPANITGVMLYHVSAANGPGAGYLSYAKADNTLRWASPGGSFGAPVQISKDGKFDIYGEDKTKFARLVVTAASLPALDKADWITISATNGGAIAASLGTKILSRFRDPVSMVSFEVDINNVAWGSAFIKPTDLKDITTDEACGLGEGEWNGDRVMLTSVRPDFENFKVSIEAVETRMYRTYGFIAPAGHPDYGVASAAQREYAFIRDSSPQYHIW